MSTTGRYASVAAHALGAVLTFYVGARSLPLCLVGVMVFDAPGSERMVWSWLLFAAVFTAPFVEMVLSMLLVALAFRRRAAGLRAFDVVVYALVAIYVGGTLASPMRQLIF